MHCACSYHAYCRLGALHSTVLLPCRPSRCSSTPANTGCMSKRAACMRPAERTACTRRLPAESPRGAAAHLQLWHDKDDEQGCHNHEAVGALDDAPQVHRLPLLCQQQARGKARARAVCPQSHRADQARGKARARAVCPQSHRADQARGKARARAVCPQSHRADQTSQSAAMVSHAHQAHQRMNAEGRHRQLRACALNRHSAKV